MSTTTFHSNLRTLSATLAVLALAGCGGGNENGSVLTAPAPTPVSPAPTPVSPAPPPAVVSTTLGGSVVKGPVAGAQVCAYAVAGSTRGTVLGSCTTSSATGSYSLVVPAGSGPLWVEATGGSYTDEVSGATVSLPAGSPLVSLATANGGSVTTMLTPLTTLAFNAARNTAGANGTLSAALVATATTQLLSSFNLPATLDIGGTLPAFGAGINSYGTALTVVSQMVANGLTLANILATTQPGTLAAAYATAAAPPPTGGGGTTATPSASGTLTVGGTTATGAATSLVPQADGFEVGIKDSGATTTYRFFRTTTSPASTVDVTVSIALGGSTTVSYTDQVPRTFVFCSANCGVTVTPASGATHPVTVAFANTPLSGGLTLNGSLVGDVVGGSPGAAWSLADLPGATSSSLTLGGTSVRALTSTDSTIDAGGGTTIRSLSLRLSDGSTVALSQTGTGPFGVTRVLPPSTAATCGSGCNVTVADGSASRITFANTPLSGGLVLNGTVDFARTSGSLNTNDTGSFTPVASSVESLNGKRTLTFNVLGTAAQAGLSLVTLDVVGGRVVRAQATVGIASQVLSCFDNGAGIGIPACDGVTVAADGRTATFTNAVLRGGAVGAVARNVTFNGTVVARGP